MDWQDEVQAVLDAIPDSEACFQYPAKWPNGTVITFSGINDVPGTLADDAEYTTKIETKVDVWDFDPSKVKDTVKLVKQAMRDIDFERTYCFDLYETNSRLHHTTMRFARSQ